MTLKKRLWLAGAVLFPTRTTTRVAPPEFCVERRFEGVEVQLAGWQCASGAVTRKGTVVYLHGIGDNRSSASGVVTHLLTLGYDVIAYDSRAHGASEGEQCTYGYYEKEDLRRVIAHSGATEVVLMGHSLGGAVALQAAAIEPAVRAVIAISTFSDLRSVVTERAPEVFFPRWAVAPALDRAAAEGRFVIDDVSPLRAAARITVPTLLIHGEADYNTPPSHSERVFHALQGTKRLLLVPGAGHNDVVRHQVWEEIEGWLSVTLVK